LRCKFCPLLLLFAGLAVLLAGCQEQINYPAPVIRTLSPTSISAGSPTFSLTVNASNVTPASTVSWNSTPLATFFVSTAQLTAQVPATLINNAGTSLITITTPQPGGGTSLSLTFTINPLPSAVPTITALSPSGVLTNSPGFTLTVTGTNFVSTSVVTVRGNDRPTSFVNSTTLEAAMSDSDTTTAGELQIAVLNPQPSGGASTSFPLNILNPLPGLTALSPTTTQAGTVTTLTLTATGTGYVSNSTVLVNGSPRTTAFTDSTSVSASLMAGDLAAGGSLQVQIQNPSPGGGVSNALAFPVTPTATAGMPVLVDVANLAAAANNGVCGTGCASGVPTLSTAGPSVSGSGQYVVFASTSSNLLASGTNGLSQVYVRNTCFAQSGCTPNNFLVSQTTSGTTPNGPSWQPSIASGGAQGAYTSTATNLASYATVPAGTRQVYWTPVCTSSSATPSASSCTVSGTTTTSPSTNANTAILASLSADTINAGNADSYDPVISPDGQYVAFVSLATNLVTGVTVDGVTPQVYIRSICSGVTPNNQTGGGCAPTTYLVSTPDGVTPGNGASSNPSISNDGLFVSFQSSATNLGATAPNPTGAQQVFERSTCVTTIDTTSNTCVPITNLVSTPDGVTPANGASMESAISSDGRFVAFASTATNLGTNSGGTQEIYARDTCTGVAVTVPVSCTPATYLVSTPDTALKGSTPANGLSEDPSISECATATGTIAVSTCSTTIGQVIAFASRASNLAPTQNGVENVFVRSTCLVLLSSTTACSPATLLVSQPAGNTPQPSNGDSVMPSVSGDGRTVGFISSATNLVPFGVSGFQDIFLGLTTF
jgi:WD40-like Beta Propeller Repeat